MVVFLSFVALLLLALLARTSPVPVELVARGPVYSNAERAQYGVPVRNDVTRFVVKYATARRWEPSTVVSILQGVSLLQQVPTSSSYPVNPRSQTQSIGPSPRLSPVWLKFYIRGLPLYGYLCSQLRWPW